jgi:hypothetical protein
MRSKKKASAPTTPSQIDQLRADLLTRYPADIVDPMLDAYAIAKRAAFVDDLQKVETHFGQFCEAAIRICRFVVTGGYTPIGDSRFKVNTEITATTSKPKSKEEDEPFRVLIPHTIQAMYNIRNRRGVDHLSQIKPNHIDARVLTAQADWILAELTRLATRHDFAQAQALIDALVDRQIPLLEMIHGEWKLLETNLGLQDAILLALYHDDKLLQADIVAFVKRGQSTVSKAITNLDVNGFLHKSGRIITITSKGRNRVERLPEVRDFMA